MSTLVSEEDWEHTLLVFRACLPRRGRKAEDDRLFFGGAAFFHGGECTLAGASEGIWEVEQCVEAV